MKLGIPPWGRRPLPPGRPQIRSAYDDIADVRAHHRRQLRRRVWGRLVAIPGLLSRRRARLNLLVFLVAALVMIIMFAGVA